MTGIISCRKCKATHEFNDRKAAAILGGLVLIPYTMTQDGWYCIHTSDKSKLDGLCPSCQFKEFVDLAKEEAQARDNLKRSEEKLLKAIAVFKMATEAEAELAKK